MLDISIEECIRKVTLLEKSLGTKIQYQILDPFPLYSKDIVGIQNAGKIIAEFIGLSDYIFVISINKLEKNTGGHIELKYGNKQVFIEISEEILKFEDAILAILAHEITHEYLYINNISFSNKYENEILTDIAAIFFGFGKLMLNGSENEDVWKNYYFGGSTTITDKLGIGYLDRSKLALVYLLVCTMRNISEKKYMPNLSNKSIQLLEESTRDYWHIFNNPFNQPEKANKSLSNFHSIVYETQLILCDINKKLVYLQKSNELAEKYLLEEIHRKISKILLGYDELLRKDEYDPCLKFMNITKFNQDIARFKLEMKDNLNLIKSYQKIFNELASYLKKYSNVIPEPNSDVFRIMNCPNCKTKLRLPEDKNNLSIKCPNCKYRFIVNTLTSIEKKPPSIKKLNKLLHRLN
jgi:DNA-directed RNA polymerase subunit RPC12/RpoP